MNTILVPIHPKLTFPLTLVPSIEERWQGLNSRLELSSTSASFLSIIFPIHVTHSVKISPALKVFIWTGLPSSGTLWVPMTSNVEQGHRGVRDELEPVYTVVTNTGQLNIGGESSLREARAG